MPKDFQKEDTIILPKLPSSFSIRPCLYCNIDFVGWSRTKYCSIECRKAVIVKKTKGIGITKNCKSCGNQFYVPLSAKRQTHCSIVCRSESLKIRINKICPICNVGFDVKRSWDRIKYCSTTCYHKAMRTKHASPDAILIKRRMRQQGLIKECNRCGYNEHIEILVTHHIDRDRQNNCLNNIEILCPNCHAIEHHVKPIEGISLSA